MRNGDENVDDIAGRFTGTYTGADAILQVWDNQKLTQEGKGLPRVVKERPQKYPTARKKSQSVA